MVERKFNLMKGGKKRTVSHLLYKQWPGKKTTIYAYLLIVTN